MFGRVLLSASGFSFKFIRLVPWDSPLGVNTQFAILLMRAWIYEVICFDFNCMYKWQVIILRCRYLNRGEKETVKFSRNRKEGNMGRLKGIKITTVARGCLNGKGKGGMKGSKSKSTDSQIVTDDP